jgi:hypothetical protein
MVGAFVQAIEQFGRFGIAIIPTALDDPTKPLVRNPGRFRPTTIRNKFANANAAMWCGPDNNLTIIDVDATGDYYVDMMRDVCGDTPVSFRTPSNGTHLLYRHNGERRVVRVFEQDDIRIDVPVDLLGDGMAILPPSKRPKLPDKCAGTYTLIGDIEALAELPRIRDGAIPDIAKRKPPKASNSTGDAGKASRATLLALPPEKVPVGQRNDYLFYGRARDAAHECSTSEELLQATWAINKRFPEPMSLNDVMKVVGSLWTYKENGTLFRKGGAANIVVPWPAWEPFAGCPDGLFLFGFLKKKFGASGRPFPISPRSMKQMAMIPGWSERRIRTARQWLLDHSIIETVYQGGNSLSDPSLFRFKNNQ